MSIVKYIKGDLLECSYDIAHGVNCQNKMGSGVAKAIYTKYPQVKEEYHRLFNIYGALGNFQSVFVTDEKEVFNLFIQKNYGYDGKKYVSYSAIISSFEDLNWYCKANGITKLGIPKIGAGLAGGKWEVIKELIDEVTPNVDIYVYYLEEK